MAETALNETRQYPHLADPARTAATRTARFRRGAGLRADPRSCAPARGTARPHVARRARRRRGRAGRRSAPTFPWTCRPRGAFSPGSRPRSFRSCSARPFRPRQAAAVGHALVQADFVECRRARAQPAGADLAAARAARRGGAGPPTRAGEVDMEQRVAAVTEALANGYVRALRDRTLAEQESIMRAGARRPAGHQRPAQAPGDARPADRPAQPRGRGIRPAVRGARAGRGTGSGLCYLDLDGFKAVNDRYGHDGRR